MSVDMKKIFLSLLLVLIALASILIVADRLSAPELHADTTASIDDKVATVLKLSGTSALASAGVSALPGDAATPIAEKLADFTEYFLLILCVLYAEKYLISILGLAAFKILIPAACALGIIGLYWNPRTMKRLAFKFLIFAIAFFLVIPLSIRISDMIYNTYRGTIEQTLEEAEDLTGKTELISEADQDEGLIRSILTKLSETATSLADKASATLKNFVESLAIMIVTSCIIPILVLVFFVWLIRKLTGIELSMPHMPKKHPHEISE